MTLKRFLALCGLVAVGLCPSRPAAAQHFDPKALYEIVGPGGLGNNPHGGIRYSISSSGASVGTLSPSATKICFTVPE